MNNFKMENFSLEGKIALVTGASYGIGYGIASGLAKAGARIIFNDINQELVDKGIATYKADGIDAKGYVCDVTDEEAVQALVKRIEEDNIILAYLSSTFKNGSKQKDNIKSKINNRGKNIVSVKYL